MGDHSLSATWNQGTTNITVQSSGISQSEFETFIRTSDLR
jgi:hypothetical protein